MGSGGGGSTVTGVDKTYNAGMLALSEEQQDWARQYMEWAWGGGYTETAGYYNPTVNKGNQVTVEKVSIGGDSSIGVSPFTLWKTSDGQTFTTEEEANAYASRASMPDTYSIGDQTFGTKDEAIAYAQAHPDEAAGSWVEGGREWSPTANAGNSYMDYQQALLDANQRMLTPQTDLTLAQIAAQQQLLPQQTALTEKEIASQSEILDLKMPVAREFYNQSLNGINVSDEIAKARADVEIASKNVGGEWRREAGRMGIDPTSGRYASQRGADLREKAKALSGASTSARRYAQGINYDRLSNAMGATL